MASRNVSPNPPLLLSPRATMQKRQRVLPAVALHQPVRTDEGEEIKSCHRQSQRTCCGSQPNTSEDAAPNENEDQEVEQRIEENLEDQEVERSSQENPEDGPRVPCELALAVRNSISDEFDWLLRLALPSDSDKKEKQVTCSSDCIEEPMEPQFAPEAISGIFPVEEVDGESRGWSEELDHSSIPSLNSTCRVTDIMRMTDQCWRRYDKEPTQDRRGADFMRMTDQFWRRYEKEPLEDRRPAWRKDDPVKEAASTSSLARKQDARRAKLQRLIGMRNFSAAAQEALRPADVPHDRRELSRQVTSEKVTGNPFGVVQPQRSDALASLEIMSARRRELSEARKALEKVVSPRGRSRDEFRSELGSMFQRQRTETFV